MEERQSKREDGRRKRKRERKKESGTRAVGAVGARHARVCQAHSRLLKEGSSLHPLGLLVLLLALEVSRVVTTSLLVLVVVVVAATPLLNSRLALFLVGRRTGGGRDAKDVRQLPGVGGVLPGDRRLQVSFHLDVVATGVVRAKAVLKGVQEWRKVELMVEQEADCIALAIHTLVAGFAPGERCRLRELHLLLHLLEVGVVRLVHRLDLCHDELELRRGRGLHPLRGLRGREEVLEERPPRPRGSAVSPSIWPKPAWLTAVAPGSASKHG